MKRLNPLTNPDLLKGQESIQKALRQTAALAAEYYEALTDAGIPNTLAENLVRDWHDYYWQPEEREE